MLQHTKEYLKQGLRRSDRDSSNFINGPSFSQSAVTITNYNL